MLKYISLSLLIILLSLAPIGAYKSYEALKVELSPKAVVTTELKAITKPIVPTVVVPKTTVVIAKKHWYSLHKTAVTKVVPKVIPKVATKKELPSYCSRLNQGVTERGVQGVIDYAKNLGYSEAATRRAIQTCKGK